MRVFEEKQWFNQWWFQLINIGLSLFLLFCLYKWFVAEENVDKVSPDDLTGQLIVILCLVPVIALFYFLKLKTVIDERGISYQFFPIHKNAKLTAWSDLEECYTREYKPIAEYGGWGYKFGAGGAKALNVKGNKGIQLKFKSGKKLLIGTQKPEDAQVVINRYFKNERI
jgi:hypothetical protein